MTPSCWQPAAPLSTDLGVSGEDLDDVISGLEFLEAVKRGEIK